VAVATSGLDSLLTSTFVSLAISGSVAAAVSAGLVWCFRADLRVFGSASRPVPAAVETLS